MQEEKNLGENATEGVVNENTVGNVSMPPGGDVDGSVQSGHEEVGPSLISSPNLVKEVGEKPGPDVESNVPVGSNATDEQINAATKPKEDPSVLAQAPTSVAGNLLAGTVVEKTVDEYLATKGMTETDIHVMAAVVHDILRVILGRFENLAVAGDFRLVHSNEAKVFREFVTGAIEKTDGNTEEFYMGLCECYANNGYQMSSEYNPVSKKTIWGKPITGLTKEQQLAFNCIFSFLAAYIDVRQLQLDDSK